MQKYREKQVKFEQHTFAFHTQNRFAIPNQFFLNEKENKRYG